MKGTMEHVNDTIKNPPISKQHEIIFPPKTALSVLSFNPSAVKTTRQIDTHWTGQVGKDTDALKVRHWVLELCT